MTKIREKYVGGNYFRSSYGETLSYNDFEMKFYDGDLTGIILSRERTVAEEIAKHNRDYELKIKRRDSERASEEAEARKTPEQKAREISDAKARKEQQMESDYKELLDQLDAKLREGERIINSEKIAIAAGGMFKDAVQKKINKVTAAGDSLIDSFSKKYQGMIPAWMVKGIQAKWRPVQNP